MPASAVYILDNRGKPIIHRDYRGDIPSHAVDKFVRNVIDEEESKIKPVFEHNDLSFVHITYNGLYLVCVARYNANATLLLLFLYRMVDVFQEYFSELEEESIRDNFVLVYELLDEMMDFGYPQATEPKILKKYITQKGFKLNLASSIKNLSLPSVGNNKPAAAPGELTNKVYWRPEGISYRKNEVFLDVIESLDLLVSSSGTTISSEIRGRVRMRVYLSGMPRLKLGLNDRVLQQSSASHSSRSGSGGNGSSGRRRGVELDDVKFHQCAEFNTGNSDRTVSFVPPDGEFDLMTYRLTTKVKPLILVEAKVEKYSHSRIEFLVKAKANFKRRSAATSVEITVPVPPDADTPLFKTSLGKARYVPESDAIVWTMKQFQGGKTHAMRAHMGLPSIEGENHAETVGKRPIGVKFEIPYFTVSGLQVKYLKIMERSNYQALPWVRYITQSGDYQIRMK